MRLPLTLRAIVGGVVIGMAAANVWPILLINFGAPLGSAAEAAFLCLYLWWVTGGGWPKRWRPQRRDFARANPVTGAQWAWGLLAAVAFAATVHAAIVLLFRLVPFPARDFHAGYDFSFIPSRTFQWLACVVSAVSAGICEEVGFRGYMQRPIENRHGPLLAILVSSAMFTLIHLNKSWALLAMTPVIFGAGLLLGALARASGTLVFCIIGHAIMDVGLFAYWWTQIAGTFTQRPIFETGLEPTFLWELAAFSLAVAVVIMAVVRLGRLSRSPPAGATDR